MILTFTNVAGTPVHVNINDGTDLAVKIKIAGASNKKQAGDSFDVEISRTVLTTLHNLLSALHSKPEEFPSIHARQGNEKEATGSNQNRNGEKRESAKPMSNKKEKEKEKEGKGKGKAPIRNDDKMGATERNYLYPVSLYPSSPLSHL